MIRSLDSMPAAKCFVAIAAIVIFTSSFTFAVEKSPFDAEGIWQGTLKLPVAELRVLLRVVKNDDAGLTATLDSVDQGVNGIKIESFVEAGSGVRFEGKTIGCSFDGAYNDDKSTINGVWNQAGQKLPLTFLRLEKEPEFRKPQQPMRPFPYDELSINFSNPKSDVTLAGTLTVPRSAGPHPAVILVSGSGPQDRDETILGHRPFLVLAHHLTSRGIAVLRFDDRGTGESTGSFWDATLEDHTDDALAGIEFLTSQARIDGANVGVIGHSEGGIVAPMAAVRSDSVSFIVMMAGPGLPLQEILNEQSASMIRSLGMPESIVESAVFNTAEMCEILSQVDPRKGPNKNSRQELKRVLEQSETLYTPEQLKSMGYSNEQTEATMARLTTPWFVRLVRYDPIPTLTKVGCPVLAICGEKDQQVSAAKNLKAIGDALLAGGNQRVKTMEMKGLNHLFQTCETGSPSEYGKIDETFSEDALSAISDWILQITGLPPLPKKHIGRPR